MEYLRGFELGLGVYEVDVRREYALIDIIQIINISDMDCYTPFRYVAHPARRVTFLQLSLNMNR